MSKNWSVHKEPTYHAPAVPIMMAGKAVSKISFINIPKMSEALAPMTLRMAISFDRRCVSSVCPHTLNTRSIVLSAEDVIEIEIASGKDGGVQQVEVNFDGCHPVMLYTGDRIAVRKSEKETRILKLSKASFLETLHKKMSGA